MLSINPRSLFIPGDTLCPSDFPLLYHLVKSLTPPSYSMRSVFPGYCNANYPRKTFFAIYWCMTWRSLDITSRTLKRGCILGDPRRCSCLHIASVLSYLCDDPVCRQQHNCHTFFASLMLYTCTPSGPRLMFVPYLKWYFRMFLLQ